MLRSVAAVLMGYLLFALSVLAFFTLSGREPHAPASLGFMAVSVVYGLFFSVLGGYIAAAIAGEGKYEIEHAFAVATLIAAIGAASLIAESPAESKWTQLSAILIVAPAAIVGGYLRRRQLRNKMLEARRLRHQ